MDQATLTKLMEAEEKPQIVDVRSAWEYAHGHVPGALHLPFWRSFLLPARLNKELQVPVVLYCEHGPRALLAWLFLRCRGIVNLHILKGHMLAWRRAGLAIEVT